MNLGDHVDDQITTAPTEATTGRQVGRRSVIVAAAHAAWVVPVVQVVAAAPAFATSTAPQLSITSAVINWADTSITGTLGIDVTVANPEKVNATLSSITLTFPLSWNPTTVGAAPVGWGVTGSGSRTIVYTLTTPFVLGPGKTKVLSVTSSSLNPVDAYVGAGSYVADGGGLSVIATTAPGIASLPYLVDLEGAYANLAVTSGTATWITGKTTKDLTIGGTVTNRGRTAVPNPTTMRITVGLTGLSNPNSTTAPGGSWSYQAAVGTAAAYLTLVQGLAPGASAAAFSMTYTWNANQKPGGKQVTLTPSTIPVVSTIVAGPPVVITV